MRFPARPPIAKIKKHYDVVISQNFGHAIDSWRARTMPNGGSEMHTVIIAEGFQRVGYSVAVIQPGPHMVRWAGVDYYSLEDVIHRELYDLECDVLISQRFGELPQNVSFARLVVEMHDLPDERAAVPMGFMSQFMSQIPGCKTVVHSKFNEALYPEWPGMTVIPAAFEDSLYTLPRVERKPHKRERVFVSGSAALKGLQPTLALWKQLHDAHKSFRRSTLIVTSPGYDSPDWEELRKTPGVVFEQQPTPGDMMTRIANSDGLFQVNALPETFGCVHVMAEIVGRPAWVLAINGSGALKEVLANPWSIHTHAQPFVNAVAAEEWPEMLPARDYSASAVMPAWIDVCGLKSKAVAA